MHLIGSISSATVSGIARHRGLGNLGASVNVTSELIDSNMFSVVYNALTAAGVPGNAASQGANYAAQLTLSTSFDVPTFIKGWLGVYLPASQHISQADAILGANQAATQMSAQRSQGSIVTQADQTKLIAVVNRPSITLIPVSTPVYSNLSDTHATFAGIKFDQPILQPHLTNALNWCAPGDGTILNIGAPVSLYDPVEYLRSALVDSDWARVKYWFGSFYSKIFASSGLNKDPFYPFGALNLFSYKYTIDNGVKTYWPFSYYDLQQFIVQIMGNFMLTDTGQHNQVLFGFIDYNAAQRVDPKLLVGNAPMIRLAIESLPSSTQSSIYRVLNNIASQGPGSSPREVLPVGWVPAPAGPWDWGAVFGMITVAATFYFVGSVVAGWLSTAFSTTAQIPAATAAETTATTTAATSAGAVAGTTAILDEVVITGTVASSVSVGAALTAGAVAVVAAPAIIGATAPTIQTPPTSAPVLDEVIVSGTVPASTSVGASLTAGAVAIATAPAVFSTPTISAPQTNATAPDQLDEVVVTGTAPSSVSTVGAAVAAGSIIATAAPAISNATTASDANTTTQPDQAQASDDQPSKGETLEDWLKSLAKKYGLTWVKSHLLALLKQYLKHTPTQAEIDAANASLDGGGINWWVIGAAALAALVGSS